MKNPEGINRGGMEITEEDSSPSTFPYKLKFPNTSLTDNGDGTTSISFPSSMVYPSTGIALSTGSAWGTSITNNSSNWNTAYTHSQETGSPHTWAGIDKTVSSIADITTKSHTALSDIGTNTHAQLDTFKDTTVPTTYAPLASPVFTTPIRLKGYTVATLPAGTQGDICFITDALAPSFLVTAVGGGAVVTPVFFDGSSWKAF